MQNLIRWPLPSAWYFSRKSFIVHHHFIQCFISPITFNWQQNITQPTIQHTNISAVCPFSGLLSSFSFDSPSISPQRLWVFHSTRISLSRVWLVCDRYPAIRSFWAQFPLIRCFFSAQNFVSHFPYSIRVFA